MDNTGSPKCVLNDLVVFAPKKTRIIGRIPSQTALIAKAPLMGSLSRRKGGPSNGNPNKDPPAPNGGQDRPKPQTSFPESDVPDPTFSPETKQGGSKPTDHPSPSHQTSFPQSDPPEQAPRTKPAGNGGPLKTHDHPSTRTSSPDIGLPSQVSTTANGSPPESTSEAGHSAGHKESNIPGATTITVESSISVNSSPNGFTTDQAQSTGISTTNQAQSTGISTTGQARSTGISRVHGSEPQAQSFTDTHHGHSKSNNPFSSKSQTFALSSTQPFPTTFSSIFVSTSGTQALSSLFPTESGIGKNPGHKGGNSTRPPKGHSESTTQSLTSTTNGPQDIRSSITQSESLASSSPTIDSNTSPSRPTHPPNRKPPGHGNPTVSNPTVQSILPPLTRIPPPIHFSAAPSFPPTTTTDTPPPPKHTNLPPTATTDTPPPPKHTNKHQTTFLSGLPAAPPPQTTSQVASRPLIPLPLHISKAPPAPPPVVTTATTPAGRPVETPPDLVTSINQPSRPTSEQGPPPNTIRPTPLLIPAPFSQVATVSQVTTVSIVGGPVIVSSPDVSAGKGALAKELLNPTIAPTQAQPLISGISSAPALQGQTAPGGSTFAPENAPTASTTFTGHHRPDSSGNSVSSSASNNSAAVVGGVLGAIIGLLVIAFVVLGFCFYRRKLRKLRKKLQAYEKDGDIAPPPLYAPSGTHPGHDSRVAYNGQPFTSGNQDIYSTPPIPTIVATPAPTAQLDMHQTHNYNVSREFEGQMLTVPPYAKSMNPFTNLAAAYPYPTNGGNQGRASEKDHTSVDDGLSQYPVEKPLKENRLWSTFQGPTPPNKTFDPHLSKISTGTTVSVGTAYSGKRSSTSTYINDPDENFGDVEFDSLKMVKPRTANVVGLAM